MNNSNLSKSAQKVQEALAKNGVDFKVLELSSSTRTANDAAATIGCDVAQIVKSLIFKTQNTHQPLLVLASGPNRVNENAIANLIGEKIEKADAKFTHQVTGFAIGGVPPIGHRQAIKTLIDEDLSKFNELWAAAGTPNAVFNLKFSDLQTMSGGEVISIK